MRTAVVLCLICASECFVFQPSKVLRRPSPACVKPDEVTESKTTGQGAKVALFSLALAAQMFGGAEVALADGGTGSFKYPPIDATDKNRCKFLSSAIGQANAARDKLYDLRECKMTDLDASTYDLSGAIMANGQFTNTVFKEAVMSKIYGEGANFENADFSNAVIDRGYWKGAIFKGAIFNNAVLSGSNFDGADVENADFENAYLGVYDQRALCKNPTLKGENPKTGAPTRASAGCGG